MQTTHTSRVFDTATSARGMNKIDTARFHCFNPNGAAAKLPTDFTLPDGTYLLGLEMIFGRRHNYHVRQLLAFLAGSVKFTRWDINYHVRGILEDAARYPAFVAKRAHVHAERTHAFAAEGA